VEAVTGLLRGNARYGVFHWVAAPQKGEVRNIQGISQMRDDLLERPPLEPEEDVVIVDEPTFLNACKSLIAEDAERFEWSFGNALLTRSEKWGLIWRVDFTTKYGGPVTNRTNRIICWGDASGSFLGLSVSFGQAITQL
jgi:hypothetical protein